MGAKQGGAGKALTIAAGLAAVAATGGAAAGLVAPGLAAAAGGGAVAAGTTGLSVSSSAKAAQSLKRSILKPISNTKPLPTIDDEAVKAARNNELISLQQRSGRASTQLSQIQGTKTTFGA